MAAESTEEIYVRELLHNRFGTVLRRLEESSEKTPDYEVLLDGLRVAVLEVKTLVNEPISEAKGWVRDSEEGFWRREQNDNGTGRVAQRIHDAAKQLTRYDCPRVLVFLNDEMLDVHDLEEACNGYLVYGTSETGYIVNAPWEKRAALTRIAEKKKQIDLYIWIDRLSGREIVTISTGEVRKPGEVFFRLMTPVGKDLAQRCFGKLAPATPQETP